MLTEAYKNKIKPFLKFYRFIYKFRVIILIILTVIVGITATLLGLKGFVIDTIKISDISYGEKLQYSSKGLFTDYIRYEFSKADEDEWSEVEPTFAGDYKIRGISKSIFGTDYYGSATEFSINPLVAEVRILNNNPSSVYGELPNLDYGLINDDSIISADFDCQNISGGKGEVSFEKNSFQVINSDGVDVSGCYDFKLESSYQIPLTKRGLTFSSKNSFDYDGSYHSYDKVELTSGTLAFDDYYRVTSSESFKVGSNSNKPKIEFYNKHGEDVTSLYNCSYTSDSKVTINARPITIKTENYTKTYDAKADNFEVDYRITSGSLVSGDKISLKAPLKYDAGVYDLIPTIIITDQEGNDVTDGYDVAFDAGKYTINPRSVSCEIEYFNKTYDGYSIQFAINETGGNLCENHYYDRRINGEYSYKDLVRSGIKTDLINITIKSGNNDVTKNYTLTVRNISGTVTKRSITISTGSTRLPYNGSYQSYVDYSITSGTLAETDSISVNEAASYKDVGTYENKITFNIYNQEEDFDSTVDYNITYDYGTITIYEDDPGSGSCPGGSTDPSLSNNDYNFSQGQDGESKLLAKYTSNQIHDSLLLKSNTYNYYSKGKLTIAEPYTPKYGINPLNFIADLLGNTNKVSGRLEYVGYTSRKLDYIYSLPILPDTWLDDTYAIVSNLNEKTISISGYSYDYINNPSLIENATFSNQNYVNEELNYRKFVYDNYLKIDSSHSSALNDVILNNNLNGGNLNDTVQRIISWYKSDFLYSSTDIPSSSANDPILDFLVNNHQGKCDYFAEGAVLILRKLGYPARMISGIAANGTKSTMDLYSDMLHAQAEIYLDGKGWVPVEFTVAPLLDPTDRPGNMPGEGDEGNPGDEGNQGGEGDEGNQGNEGSEGGGSFTIISSSNTYTYDGEAHSFEFYTIENGDLQPGHKLEVTFNSEIKYPGSKFNLFTYKIYDENGKDVTDTYEVTTEYGTLILKEAELTVTTPNETTALSDIRSGNYSFTPTVSGLVNNDEVKTINRFYTSINAPGTYRNIIMIDSIVDQNGEDVTHCYDIYYAYGTLIVTE